METAQALGRAIGSQNIHLVYGGGTIGLMGEIARSVVASSPVGKEAVHGIIPKVLAAYERDPAKIAAGKLVKDVPEVEIYGHTSQVSDMHKRKKMMTLEVMNGGPGSGFIALPGGFGTLEELAEIITWNQLGVHDKGVVVINVGNFWEPWMAWVDNAIQEGFIRESMRDACLVANTAEEAIELLKTYKPVKDRLNLKWDDLAPPPKEEIISTRDRDE
ncbi:hypothetical protein HYALB_00000463 [Hymenoscyphus albidus]|uniref:Lysine decarboxylase-like protein n=1 Tax=Hymenoscyphus albidus TaxID=595503 RepID=A0A9N9PTU3_9HELO|nr:hypothetical protein HYALB_00000463 [Hymenoscyphus albidus]